ncbi:hypothetical protein D3C85_1124140 [compost metagenome]
MQAGLDESAIWAKVGTGLGLAPMKPTMFASVVTRASVVCCASDISMRSKRDSSRLYGGFIMMTASTGRLPSSLSKALASRVISVPWLCPTTLIVSFSPVVLPSGWR